MRRLHHEQGSLTLALLAVIMLGGLVSVLAATAVQGQRLSGRDERVERSLHTAEVGIDRVSYMATNENLLANTMPLTITGDVGGEPYTVEVTQPDPVARPLLYTIRSTGTTNEVTRTVAVDIEGKPIFPVAFFADERLQANGRTAFCRQGTGCGTPGAPANIDGLAGSNNIVTFNGAPSMSYGDVVVADWAANPDPDRCNGGANPPCTGTDYELQPERYEIEGPAHLDFIDELAATCNSTQFDNVTVVTGTIQPGVYCLDDSLPEVTIKNMAPAGTSGDVQFVWRGTGTVKLDRGVNSLGSSTRVQLYSNTTAHFELRSNSDNRLLVYAPNAECSGQGNITFYGSMLCRIIEVGGNTAFYAPEDLSRVMLGRFEPHNWREE